MERLRQIIKGKKTRFGNFMIAHARRGLDKITHNKKCDVIAL